MEQYRKEIQRQQQMDWYSKNKEKSAEKKKIWYEKNRERALAKNREYRERLKIENLKLVEKRNLLNNETQKKFNSGLTYFEILDILRKDKKHYLWFKCHKQWNENDWFNFLELKDK